MFGRFLCVQALLLAAATAALQSQKRWTNGDTATGTTDPNVTNDCTYWANNIASDDTCEAVAAYFDITTDQLIKWNPELRPSYCVLITGWSYCVSGPDVNINTVVSTATPTRTTVPGTLTYNGTAAPTQSGLFSSCTEYYLVHDGDSCYTIQDKYMSFTLAEFYSWNPSISSGCANLKPGYFVCVAAGGSASTPSTATATSTTASTTTGSSASAFPTQPGVSSSCDEWFYVVNGTSCQDILDKYSLSISQFYSWNPAVGPTCTNLWLETYVCVGVSSGTSASATIIPTKTTLTTSTTPTASPTSDMPSPHQSGIASDCVQYYMAQSGDSCWSIVNQKFTWLTQDQFIEWNPALGTSCALLADEYYCVAVKAAQPMPGTIGTCAKWHLAVSGDGCWAIEQEYGITAAQFNLWNPNVESDCAGLWLGYYVCVGV